MKKEYKQEQFLITSLLEKSIKNNKIVQSYMFSSSDINYIYDYAIDFSKDLICDGLSEEERNTISNRIDKNIFPELKIIEPINNVIKKEQFLSIKEYLSNKPLEGNKIVYIIKNCEKMNKKTANSMLKFIEEASDNLIAIFLTNNIDLVLPTIKSRCQLLNFCNINNDIYSLLNIKEVDENDIIEKVILFFKSLEKNKINTFFKTKEYIHNFFTSKEEINTFFKILLYIYYDFLNYLVIDKIKYFTSNKEIYDKLKNDNNINIIINKIKIIEHMIEINNYNLNQKLLIDNFILEISEV